MECAQEKLIQASFCEGESGNLKNGREALTTEGTENTYDRSGKSGVEPGDKK